MFVPVTWLSERMSHQSWDRSHHQTSNILTGMWSQACEWDISGKSHFPHRKRSSLVMSAYVTENIKPCNISELLNVHVVIIELKKSFIVEAGQFLVNGSFCKNEPTLPLLHELALTQRQSFHRSESNGSWHQFLTTASALEQLFWSAQVERNKIFFTYKAQPLERRKETVTA